MSLSAALPSRRPGLVVGRLAELAGLFGLLLVALAMRVVNLDGPRSNFPDLFDEGIRSEQLLLMANGFRPFRDIYSAQGLLLLDLLYPFYAAFGGTLGAARLAVGLLSVLGIAGAWWSGRQAGGAVGGLAAAFLLVVSAPFLESSRLALAEVPSLVPCLWAIGCGVRWQRGGGPRWLYAAAALATLGVLVKPMAASVVVPLGLLALSRPGLQWRQVAIAVGIAVGITALAVLALGPAAIYEQIVAYRLGARQGGTWEFRSNYKMVITEPSGAQPGLFALAGLGGLVTVSRCWRLGLALLAWPLAAIGMLLLYFPLHPKHLVYMVPPLALAGGVGLGQAARLAWAEGVRGRGARLATVGLALVLAAIPLGALSGGTSTPSTADANPDDADLNVYDRDVARDVRVLAGPGDFILTDHPYLAALGQRMVPPDLVDISRGRTRAGALTGREVIDNARGYDVRLVLVWADRLRRLSGVPTWLDEEYVLTDIFGGRNVKTPRGAKDRSIYLRRDSDFATARQALEGTLQIRETVDFAGKLRILGSSVSTERIRPGEQFTVTIGWLALEPMTSDYSVALRLVDERGDDVDQQQHDLEGGARGTSTWAPGRSVFRTFAIQPDTTSPAGDYRIQVRLLDSKASEPLRPSLGPDAQRFRIEGRNEVVVGTVQVR